MSYVYTSSQVAGRVVQAPEYTTRGLDGKTTGKLDLIHLMGHPTKTQLAYDGYINNLSAFLFATAAKKKVYVNQLHYKLVLPLDKLLPFPMPPLCVSPRKALKSEAERSAFQESLGIPSEIIRYGKTEQFLMRQYSIAEFAKLPSATLNANTPSPPDSTSILGVKGFLSAVKILTLFLATHSYAAFNTPDDEHTEEYYSEFNAPKGLFTAQPTLRAQLEDSWSKARKEEHKKGASEEYGTPEDRTDQNYSASMKGMVLIAKPAPFHPTINFGSPSAIPSLPGFVLPYFRGMIHPAFDTTLGIFRRFFAGAFGDTASTNNVGWEEFCKNLRRWFQTDSGMAMSHVFFAIQAALEAQARVYVIVNGQEYLGCAILGFKFNLSLDGKLLLPYTSAQVGALAAELDQHMMALKNVCRILSELDIEDSDPVTQEEVVECKSSRALYQEICKRKKLEKGDRLDELSAALEKVTFKEAFWPITLDRLELALKTIFDTSLEIKDEWPMYLPAEFMYSESRVYQVLSAFGPMAPSFIDTSGKDFAIPAGETAEDPLSKVVEGTDKRHLENICVAGKKLSIAVGDMRYVLKKKVIKQNTKERAAGYRTIMFTGNGRNKLWSILKTIPRPEDKPSDPKGKKRARDEDGEESTKKKMREVDVIEDLNDMDF